MKLSCPACGAEVSFKSRMSILAICNYCNSTLIRHDLSLENIGKIAELPPDMSPLKIGTKGCYEGKKFELIGQMKMSWENGLWTEWYLIFEDGMEGWLGEAQGFYTISNEQKEISNIPPIETLFPGAKIMLGKGKIYFVEDIRSVRCSGVRGELPYQNPLGQKSTSVDFIAENQQFANIDYRNNKIRLYFGKYVEFDDFHFTSLREIHGW